MPFENDCSRHTGEKPDRLFLFCALVSFGDFLCGVVL
jgi:hypothetical protein